LRILHLVDHFHPWMGYQETYLAREHVGLGHDVLVIAANRYGRRPGAILGSREAPAGFAVEEGIPVRRLPVVFEMPTVWAYPWLKGLPEAIIDFKPDVIHSHGILSFSNVRAARLKKQLGFVYLVDNHTSMWNLVHPWESGFKRVLKRVFYRIVAGTAGAALSHNTDRFVAIGEPEQDFVRWYLGKNAPADIPIIRLGADQNRFKFDPQARQQIRKEKGWSDDQVILGHGGTIEEDKGIEDLLAAISRLAPGLRSRILIHLVGRIPEDYLPRLEAKAAETGLADQLIIGDFYTPDEFARVMSAWDVAVWPGDISVTALEAMAVDLPLIAYRYPYTEYMVEKYDGGTLFERGDIGALSEIVSTYVSDPALRREKGQGAREVIERELNWHAIAMKFVEQYTALLPAPPED
jgi:glycosyltransferase involved in cell wall biosynthesis